jgi:hypothetical protein
MSEAKDWFVMKREFTDSCNIAALTARVVRLEKALTGMCEMYADLVNSGDAGFWDPEASPAMQAARAALNGEPAK